MLFNSYLFIFMFFPVCLLGYRLLVNMHKTNGAKLWLIAMSMWFYGQMNIGCLFLLVGSVLAGYGFCVVLIKKQGIPTDRRRRTVLIAGICFHLGLLAFFKYAGTVSLGLHELFAVSLPAKQILLPLGISFYTFSQISFLVDSYRGEIEKITFIDYCLYVTYFPKLLQGPIAGHSELLPQFASIGIKLPDSEECYKGWLYLPWGFAKKVLLADTLGRAVDLGYRSLSQFSSGDSLLLMICYTLQLYFDFSGYCDMAMGIGRILGIKLPLNFDSPYRADSIVAFWKGWHITLNRFFMKYVYIPLGGNRKGRVRMYGNLLFIFLLSGLWHGTGMQFIVWGLMHGVLYVITRALMSGKKEERKDNKVVHVLKVLGTFLYVNASWVFFRATSVQEALGVFKTIFTFKFRKIHWDFAGCFNLDEFWYVIKLLGIDKWSYAYYILMGLFLIASLIIVFFAPSAVKLADGIKPKAVNTCLLAVLFVWCVLSFSQVTSFIYINF